MPRSIFMHLTVEVPPTDNRRASEIVAVVEDALARRAEQSLKFEIGLVEEISGLITPSDENVHIYTVHPFDEEWTWDPEKSGSHPWATTSLQEAIDHANLVRLEYASVPETDPEWIAGFWSAIYIEEESARADSMIGYVDPLGNYVDGDEPPLDSEGNWKGEQ